MSDEVNDLLMGGGVVSAKFESVGDKCVGTILRMTTRQETDFKTKKPKFFDSGEKRMMVVLAVQTNETDDEIEDDDGVRNLYVRWKMREAVKAAVKASGAGKLEVGGKILVKFSGTEKSQQGGQPIKLYEARYKAAKDNPDYRPEPAADEFDGDLGGDDDGMGDEPAKPARKVAAKKAAAKPADDDNDPGF